VGAEKEIENLIELLARLPGFGKRSARRAVLHMINRRKSLMEPIGNLINEVAGSVKKCSDCGNLTIKVLCSICEDYGRDKTKLCVVCDIADLWAMERAKTFKGRFHVLGGVLSALDGIGPDELAIPKLISRIKSDSISEIILALGATINGQTTAHYIADQLLNSRVEITSLAHGVPIGGELDYLDEGTIDLAFKGRKGF
jgi:recombination protein RecR